MYDLGCLKHDKPYLQFSTNENPDCLAKEKLIGRTFEREAMSWGTKHERSYT